MEAIEMWKKRLARKASLFVPEGAASSAEPISSWFGRVTLAEQGETWPTVGGRFMWPLLQIVVRDLPFRPPALDDIALIRVFVNPEYAYGTVNQGGSYYHPTSPPGSGWLLRASARLESLRPMPEPDHGCRVRSCRGRWDLINADYPTHDDLPLDFPDDLREDYCNLDMENSFGTKVGGWPHCVQSEIYWGPLKQHPWNPEYVFQIDSDCDRGWMWGDTGVAYFGRGTGAHRDKWEMEWQCY